MLTTNSLLAGPQATIDHDDNGDGSYQHLGGPYSLAMLTYFSTTIQQQCTGGVNGSAYMLQASRIHILKGNALALHDIFNWMQVCCGSGRLCALSEVVQNSIRYLLALGAARQLGVQLLEHEVHQTAFRLQTELLTTDQMAAIAAELDSFLREIQDAVIGNIARSFATGRLPDVKRYLGLCTTFEKFHQDVAAALQALKKCNWHPHAGEAEAAWLRKEELKVEPGQAVPPMMGAIMPAPGPFMHQAFPAQQIPIPVPPPPQSVLTYCSASTFGQSWTIPRHAYPHLFGEGHGQHHSSGAPVHIHIHGTNNSNHHHGNSYHSHHHHRHPCRHHTQPHSEVKFYACPHPRHERCHPLTCNQKTVSSSDLVTRAQTTHPPMMNYRQPSSAVDTPRYEPPKPGETPRDRQAMGGGHYLHSFSDAYGRMRYVSKGPGFRFETYGAGADKRLKYGCGCWLDAPARRHFRDDGTAVGSSARYTCDSCIRRGNPYSRCC